MERRLPKRLVIAYTSVLSSSLTLKVELESTTDATTVSTDVLADTGASSMGYLDSAFVSRSRLPTWRLLHPIPVYNVDGTLNEAGSVTHVRRSSSGTRAIRSAPSSPSPALESTT